MLKVDVIVKVKNAKGVRKELVPKGKLKWIKEKTKPFYFTFGSSLNFPYQNGYVIVWAKNLNEATEIFEAKYPNKRQNCLNCSFYYTEEQWKKQYEKTGLIENYPCFEVLSKTSLHEERKKTYERNKKTRLKK